MSSAIDSAGLAVRRHLCGACGRGPINDMSPRSTFTSWGSSSMLAARSTLPIAVTLAHDNYFEKLLGGLRVPAPRQTQV